MYTKFCESSRYMPLTLALLLILGSANSALILGQTQDKNAAAPTSGESSGEIEAESRFATLDGARIHYANYNRDSGARGKGKAKAGNDEEALVLIHGWTMNNDSWRAQVLTNLLIKEL